MENNIIDIHFLLADKNDQPIKKLSVEHLDEYSAIDNDKNKITIISNKDLIFKIILVDENVAEIIIDIYLNGTYVKTMLFSNLKHFTNFEMFSFDSKKQSFIQF